jgi:glutaconate CoA-transferase subunit A
MAEVVTPEDAVEEIESGMTIGIGGVQSMFPMALIRSLARRKLRGLVIVGPMSGMGADVLIASGSVQRVIAPYHGSGKIVPVAPAFKCLAERGEIDVWDVDTGILGAGLRAAGLGVPFFPWLGGLETSLTSSMPGIRSEIDTGTGRHYLAVPAIKVDVALLHCHEADRRGNLRYFEQTAFADPILARAARRVIASTERLVGLETALRSPESTSISDADVVVPAPWGSHPFACPGVYRQDDAQLRSYGDSVEEAAIAGADLAKSTSVLTQLACASHAEYLQQVGIEQLIQLFPG